MKNIKFLSIALLMVFVLVAGQSHAVVASPASTSVAPNIFDTSTEEFNVDIFEVRPDAGSDPLEEQDDGTYHVVSDSPSPVVRLTANISGYVQIANSTGGMNNYVGQMYVIVNGEVSVVGAAYYSSIGTDITLGDAENTITYLYVARDADGLHYAQDTVVVRVGETADRFDTVPYETVKMDANVNLNDAASSTSTVNTTGLLAYNAFTVYGRDFVFQPTIDANYQLDRQNDQVDLSAGNYEDIGVNELYEFNINADVDSSGFFGQQAKGYNYATLSHNASTSLHNATTGHYFVIHGDGVALADSAETTVEGVTVGSTSSTGTITSPIGLMVLADFGYWDIEQDAYGYAPVDWDGFNPGGFYGSVDFAMKAKSVKLLAQTADVSVSTVSPGFGAVVSLISVAALAYAMPRLRKD